MIRNSWLLWLFATASLFVGDAGGGVVRASDPDGEASVESAAASSTNVPQKLVVDTPETPSEDMAGTDKTPPSKTTEAPLAAKQAPLDPNDVPQANTSTDEPVAKTPVKSPAKKGESSAEPKPFPSANEPLPIVNTKTTHEPLPIIVKPLPPEMLRLRDNVRHCLRVYYHEPITTVEYSPWGVMHALIAFGVDTEIYAGGQKVNAIGWLCYNGQCRGMRMMYLEDGKIRLRMGPGYQGHAGQFLAMLAQCKVKPEFPLRVEGKDFTVADLIESEKETCRTKTELTFKLIGLSHYLPTDAQWKNDLGEDWDIPRLIREELAQPIVGAACGGTHRMTGFSYAVNKRTRLEEPFDGQWLRAQKFVGSYHDYIFTLQNPDGSFSTNWFASRGFAGDEDRRVQTTGHMLEWLVCSLPQDQLDDPRVIKTVNYLTDLLLDGAARRKKWEIGPRGHAIHALALYAERRFEDKAGKRDAMLARQPLQHGMRK